MSDQRLRLDVQYPSEREVRVRIIGQIDGDEAAELMDACEAHVSQQPYFMMLAIISELVGATPAARRVMVDRLRQMPPRIMAFVGGSFAQRTTAKLVLNATSVLGDRTQTVGSFFEDESAAQAWLEEQEAARK